VAALKTFKDMLTSTLRPSANNKRKAIAVFFGALLLSAPVGVALSVVYRASFAFEAWTFGSPYPPEELEFLQPAKILAAISWTYVVCAIPVLITAAVLGWRTWNRGNFSYVYAAVTAGISMAAYMAGAAYVFRHELVRVVTEGTAVNGSIYAVIVTVVITALYRWAGLICTNADRIRIDT
jgi:hypothetical protein